MRRSILPPATVTALSLLLAACGGGGGGDGVASLGDGDGDRAATATTLSEEEAEEALLEWAQCMREQGIDIQDPQIGEDGGIGIVVGRAGSGDDDERSAPPDRGAFEDAREACGEPPRLGGEFTEEDREEMQAQALAFAECMRDEGIEDFPDPDFSDAGPGAGPGTRALDRDEAAEGEGPVVAGPFGTVELDDPEVRAAFEACQAELGGAMGVPPLVSRAAEG